MARGLKRSALTTLRRRPRTTQRAAASLTTGNRDLDLRSRTLQKPVSRQQSFGPDARPGATSPGLVAHLRRRVRATEAAEAAVKPEHALAAIEQAQAQARQQAARDAAAREQATAAKAAARRGRRGGVAASIHGGRLGRRGTSGVTRAKTLLGE